MTKIRQEKNVCVVVLGDIGRSPRMQYHCQSLIEEDFNVSLIGYIETKPLESIVTSSNVKIYELNPVPDIPIPNILKYIFKTIWQIFTLFITLITVTRPKIVLIQNPPAVPTFLVCYLYCLFRGSKLIIDWHNYTHTIFALNSNPKGPLVKLIYFIEKFFGRKSTINFCVTKAMKIDLKNNWNIDAKVLYDRPPLHFAPITIAKKHNLFMKLSKDYPEFLPKDCGDFKESGVMESTAFTQKISNGDIILKKNRPAILISSTSWTQDEDFNVLLEALKNYETSVNTSKTYPNLICIITGKGPQKDYYIRKVSELNLKNVSIITPWLDAEDYPLLLASADLGVCLHWSSSGLDLPMKVVDMFGCGLPVCAINFKCLNELVQHQKNGFIFENSNDLAKEIKCWFEEFPNSPLTATRKTIEQNLSQFQQLRWSENWKLTVLPILNSLL